MSDTASGAEVRSPEEIAERAAAAGVAKTRRGAVSTLVLAWLGGAFIALAALLHAVVTTGSELGFGPTRFLGGLAFSLGLMLVVVAGAELFTGNNLLAVAWASGLVSTREVARNWVLVYAGNLTGALGTFALAWLAGVHELGGGEAGATLLSVGSHKAALAPLRAIALGTLCNGLVCLAAWMALAARSVSDKLLAVVLPVAGFVAMGFEHSVANMLILPYALALDGGASPGLAGAALRNLACVTAGNVLGGTLLVALVYWLACLRPRPPA